MPPVDPAASGEATHGSSSHRSLVSTPYRVADSRCGVGADGSVFAAPDGTSPAQCNAAGDFPCCSKFGHCGSSAEHCACSDCVDYRLVGRESRPNRAADDTPDAAASGATPAASNSIPAVAAGAGASDTAAWEAAAAAAPPTRATAGGVKPSFSRPPPATTSTTTTTPIPCRSWAGCTYKGV